MDEKTLPTQTLGNQLVLALVNWVILISAPLLVWPAFVAFMVTQRGTWKALIGKMRII